MYIMSALRIIIYSVCRVSENGKEGSDKNFSQTNVEIYALSDLAFYFLWNDLLGLEPN